ncbi:hypothetical protein BBJ29_009851, partial [Phytophthora kernoviae]
LLTAAVFVGMLCGGLVGGVAGDLYGRKPVLLTTLAINAVAAFLSAFSPNIYWLIFFRAVAGLGVGGVVASLFALCLEHVPVAARGRYVTILCSFWMVGAVLTAGTAWIMLGKYNDGTKILELSWRCFGSYGLSTWITKLFKSAGLSNPFANAFLFAGANLPGNIVSLYLIDCIGHQRLLSGALFMSAFCALLFAFNVEGSKTVIVLVSCLFNACTTAAWNGFGVLSAENFPQELRTTGISVVNCSNRVAAITAQFVNGFLMGPPPHLEALLLVTSTVMICGGITSRWIAHGGDDDIDAISKSGSEDLEVESDGSASLARSPKVEAGEQVCVEGSVMAGIFPYSLNLF